MKQLDEVTRLLNKLIDSRVELEENQFKAGGYAALKTARKNAALLKECKLYLETNPNEDFIRHQLDTKQKQLDRINDPESYENWKLANKDYVQKAKIEAKLQAIYYAEMDRKQINFQIKVLKYLLD